MHRLIALVAVFALAVMVSHAAVPAQRSVTNTASSASPSPSPSPLDAFFERFKSVSGPRPAKRAPLSAADIPVSHQSRSRAVKKPLSRTVLPNAHGNVSEADVANKLFPNATAAHEAEGVLLAPPSGASLPPITIPLQRTKERTATAEVLGNTVLFNGSLIEFGVYYMELMIGHFPLAVTIDTGSSFLAVEDQLCSNCVVAPGQTSYDWWQSTSSLNVPCWLQDCFSCATEEAVQDIGPCGFQTGYGDGTGLSGAVAYDFVTLGNYGTFALFGRILTNINGFMREVPQSQGIVGLAYPDLGCTPSCVLPLMWQYYTDGLLPNFVFGMCMGPSSGAFDIGYVDQSKALAPIQYTPILNSQFYEIGLQSILVGSTPLSVPLSSYRVIVDSGTTLMVVPEPVLTAFMAELAVSAPPSFATFSKLPSFAAPCSSAGLVDPTGYPPMQFNFDGATLQLGPEYYLLTLGNMTCLGIASFPLATATPNPLLVLGQSFLSAFYTVYDVQRSQVGFAPTSPAACAGTLPGQCGEGCRSFGASSDCEQVTVQSQSNCVSVTFDADANTCS